ncbi:MAG: hypothetical protein JJ899_16280 [Alphaproteobacteria bacterium]|nr:hypothetical protein [Alphaproteobacteria bacterium]
MSGQPDHAATSDAGSRETTDLRQSCCALLERRTAVDPGDETVPTDVDRLIFEAQVLLVCEEIYRGSKTDRLIQQAVMEIREQRPSDILDVVELRLFEYDSYLVRLRKVGTVFQQLIRGDMDRMVTRPAKVT